jgi:MATE family multidrug resistance protein
MLFDLLYWNFSFLRVGTGGLAAQAESIPPPGDADMPLP